MSAPNLDAIGSRARSTAVRACWRQWTVVGSPAVPIATRRPESILDPEALLLMSLCLRGHEKRLDDLIHWWASVGSTLISVQRMLSLAQMFPSGAQKGIHHFANLACKAGDRRWLRHAQARETAGRPRKDIDSARLELVQPGTLMLRLRAGFGVGVKPDLLSFLIGVRGATASVRLIARATGYTTTAVRVAARNMASAGLIRETTDRPVGYYVYWQPWGVLLDLVPAERQPAAGQRPQGDPPVWRFWAQLFAFLAEVESWAEPMSANRAVGEHVLASTARDLYEKHADSLELNGIRTPSPARYRGKAYLTAFAETVSKVADWVEHNL